MFNENCVLVNGTLVGKLNSNLDELENNIKLDIFSYDGFTTINDTGVLSSLSTSDNSITVTGTTKYNNQSLRIDKKFRFTKGNTYILSGKHDGILTNMGWSIIQFGTNVKYNIDGTFYIEYVATETKELTVSFMAQYPSPGEHSFTISDVTLITKQIGSEVSLLKNDINDALGGLKFSVSDNTLSITDGTNTWILSQ